MISDSKVSDKKMEVKGLRLVGRYGKHAVLVLLAAAYVSVAIGAIDLARIAIIAMAPIVFLIGLYIAVMEACHD